MNEANSELEPITWDEIKDFYKQNFNETLPESYEKSFCYAWSKSRKMPVIDLLATGYRAAQHQAKIDFAAKYDHKSPLQVIAAEYVKRRGTTGPLAFMEENRFIDGYEAGLHASGQQWISVKDKLPDYDQLVLLWQSELQAQFVGRRRESGVMSPLYYWECTSDFFEAWKEIYHPKLMNEDVVTHWQPLPKPPEEK